MIFCLSSCGGNNTEEKEIVLIDEFMVELENVAKAKQNVGEEVTVFGRIKEIHTNYCVVESMKIENPEVIVRMSTKKLAELSVDDFIAVTGKIKSYSLFGNTYSVKAKIFEEDAVMDEIFRGYIADFESGSYLSGTTLVNEYNHEFMWGYVCSRGNTFLINDDEELRNYLVGKWEEARFVSGTPSYIDSVEFKADGTYFWDKSSTYDQKGNWSVSNGRLESFIGTYPREVYVVSDNIFICQVTPNVRITEEN